MIEEIIFGSSRLRTLMFLLRAEVLNAIVVTAIVVSRWSVPVKVVTVILVVSFAIAWSPFRFLGARIRVLPDRLEYLERNGAIQRVLWSDVTHYNLSTFSLRMLNASSDLPVIFSRPVLLGERKEFRLVLAQHCPVAESVGRCTWWRAVVRAARARSRSSVDSGDR